MFHFFRLIKKQITEHQFQKISTLQKKSRNGGLNSLHTSSPLGLFVLLPLCGGTGHRTPIGGLFGASTNHQLACLLCSRLVEKQAAEHQSRGVSTLQKKQSGPHLGPTITGNGPATPHVSFGRAGQAKNIHYWPRTHHSH